MATPRRVNGYGVVKAVLSGDTFVLMGAPKERGGIPPERTIILTGLNCPKFARGKNSVDEPWAYEARELVRQKAIGEQVSFFVQHSAGDRDYGNIFVGDENLSHTLLRTGLAALKELPEGAKPNMEREELMAIENDAKAAGRGMHSKSANPADHVRNIDWQPSAEKLFDRFKGKPVKAVVNQLRNGSTLRCEVAGSVTGKPSGNPFMIVNLTLAGAHCNRVPFADKDKQTTEEPAPYAVEACQWVEARLLNREVQIVIRGIDKTDNIYGEVIYPKGDVTTRLLELGLASFVPWTAAMSPNGNAFATASQVARVAKLRLGATAPEETKTEEMFGSVTFVQSGDTVLFVNDADQAEHKFTIASVRTQRPPRRGEEVSASSAFAFDAKEFLRTRLIGQKTKVRAVVEFRRDIGSDKNRMCGTLHVKDTNIGVGLVQNGFAEVVRHKWDEPHSLSYGALMVAERTAVQTSAGMWGKKGGTVVTDLADRPRKGEEGEEAKMLALAAKGSNYLLGMKKEKNLTAVVEYVFSGGRFKLYVPKEKIIIAFTLAGCRTPRPNEPCGQEALEFSRSKLLQKTIRIEVETCDRNCNFIGNLFVGQNNLATDLITHGLSSVFGPSADRSPYGDAYYAAEEKAKEAKLKIWENYVEAAAVVTEDGEEDAKASGMRDGAKLEVKITDITDAHTFYVNKVGDPNVEKVEAAMAEYNASPPELDTNFELKKGAVVAGLFGDGAWYRVRLEGRTASGEWRAQFIDYGNADLLVAENLRQLPEATASLPPSAKACFLAGIRGPTKNSDHFEGAAQTFDELAFDRVLNAKIECVDKSNKLHLTLTPKAEDVEGGDETSINTILVREGWCRLLDRPEFKLKDYVKALKPEQDAAIAARYNIWEYGDVSDDDEEEEPPSRRFDGRVPSQKTKAEDAERNAKKFSK